MPFGLQNAPGTFQHLTNEVLAGLIGCAAYLDDVVVFCDTWGNSGSAFECCVRQANLTVNLAKCEFAKATVTCCTLAEL